MNRNLIKKAQWPLSQGHFCLQSRHHVENTRDFSVNGSFEKLCPAHVAASDMSQKCLCLNASAHSFADKSPLCVLIAALNVSFFTLAKQGIHMSCQEAFSDLIKSWKGHREREWQIHREIEIETGCYKRRYIEEGLREDYISLRKEDENKNVKRIVAGSHKSNVMTLSLLKATCQLMYDKTKPETISLFTFYC